jgi:hypothetical protein
MAWPQIVMGVVAVQTFLNELARIFCFLAEVPAERRACETTPLESGRAISLLNNGPRPFFNRVRFKVV